jgi:TetR/AcrR family transcriptional regulator
VTLPTAPARLPAGQRRLNLIETAIDLFSQKGFSGTTTKEIAAAAGVTEAIVFRHFATKRDLYQAILESRLNTTEVDQWLRQADVLMQKCDDEGLFRFLISAILDQFSKDTRFERLMLFASLEGQDLAVMHNQVAAPIAQKLLDYIARRQRSGALRKGNPRSILLAVVGVAKFYAIQKYIYKTCEGGPPDAEVIDTFTKTLMDGIRTKKR